MSDMKLPFVFIDDKGFPYLVSTINGRPWLWSWHPDKKWVTCRTITKLSEIWDMESRRLPDDQAEAYKGFDIAVQNEAREAAKA